MKKNFYSLFAAASMMLAVTSCSSEDDFGQSSNGEMTSFSVQLEGAMQSRAAGDAELIDKLYYAIYDGSTLIYPSSGNYGTADWTSSGVKLENVPLVKGNTYDIIFWAQDDDASNVYTFTDLKNISVNYEGIASNNESLDAFYYAEAGFKANETENTITLKRPFAQLNIGTNVDDWNNATKANLNNPVVNYSIVTVKGLANSFEPLTAKATGTADVTFAKATLPVVKNIATFSVKTASESGVQKYQYLALNYLLVPGEAIDAKANVDIEFSLFKNEGDTEAYMSAEIPNATIQRNYRTNIIGSWFTSENFTFNVVIDKNTVNDYNLPVSVKLEGSNDVLGYETLNAAVEAVPANGTATVILANGTYTLENGLLNITNKNITLEGVESRAATSANEGVIIDGQIRVGGTANVTIKGLTLSNENAYAEGTTQMANHAICVTHEGIVTVEQCIFNLKKANASGILDWWCVNGVSKVTVKDCTFNCNHERPMQIHVNADVQNSKFINPYRYVMQINSDAESTIVFKNNEIVKTESNGKPAYGIQITNGGSEATKLSGNKTFELSGNDFSGVTVTEGATPFVFEEGAVDATTMKGDWNQFVELKNNGKVYAVQANGSYYETIQEAVDAEATEITLGAGKFTLPSINSKTVTIKGTAKEASVINMAASAYFDSSTLTLENLTIQIPTGLNYSEQTFGFFQRIDYLNINNCNVSGGLRINVYKEAKISNSQFSVSVANGFDGYPLYYYGSTGSKVTVESCTFNTVSKGIVMYNEGVQEFDLTVNNCKFTASTKADKAAIQMHTEYGITGKLTINNTTATGFADINGGLWNEVINSSKNIYEAEEGTVTNNFTKIIDGKELIADGVVKNANGEYEISSVAGMQWFANEVNTNKKSFKGETVKLVADIDLNNAEWTPIGNVEGTYTVFNGTFDGQDHTISNFTVKQNNTEGGYGVGLFGWSGGTNALTIIQNLKVDKATIEGHHYAAVIAGYHTGKIINCHVTNSSVKSTHISKDACGDKAGIIIGYSNSEAGYVDQCTAKDCTVTASRDAGQIASAAKEAVITDCTATNVKVSQNENDTCNDTKVGQYIRNEIIGRVL